MANSMFSSNVTGTNNALSHFISQSLGASNQNSLSGLTSVLSDYSSIKSGSYGKLLKAYYAKDTNKVSAATKTNQTEKNDKAEKNEKNSVKDVLQSTVSTAKKADKASAEAATKLVDATTALDKLSYKEDNRDKIIVDIDYQFFLTPSMWASTVTIIYREKSEQNLANCLDKKNLL